MVPPLSSFIDIHTHILPGIDDGSKNTLESICLARRYQQTGVKHIVATPHYLPGTAWSASKETVLAAVYDLQNNLEQEGIDLEVLPGMEIGFHHKIQEKIDTGQILPLGNSDHYLIEPSFHGDQEELVSTLIRLSKENHKLILAHPERAEDFQKRPELIRDLVDSGIEIQVNTGSLLGWFGKRCLKTAIKLQKWGYLHYVASDAHDLTRRPPLTEKEWAALNNQRHGPQALKQCIDNTTKLLLNI